jgi:D-beta-D-heptose 7-phosphate kinase/D-beta-D-heptose 1-phosphate adenosyltransferase
MSFELTELVDRFAARRILVIGDLMLDRFIWGKVTRISPEAPVPVVHVTRDSDHLGGAANVASNIRALGGDPVPAGLAGNDEAGIRLLRAMERENISTGAIVSGEDYQTIQKTRIIAHQQQVVRVDREVVHPITGDLFDQLIHTLQGQLKDTDAIIVSDYGKGVITKTLLDRLGTMVGDIPVSVDPKDCNFDNYSSAFIITPNQGEAERMSGMTIADEDDLKEAGTRIFAKTGCRHLLITRGEQGMAVFHGPGDMQVIPTRAREVFDVSGAGDTVIATFTLAHAAGASLTQAAVLANAAAGVVVGKLGTATLSPDELKAAITR